MINPDKAGQFFTQNSAALFPKEKLDTGEHDYDPPPSTAKIR